MRNKKVLIFLVEAVAFVLLYLVFFIFPTLNRISFLKAEIPQKEQDVQEMEVLKAEYISIKKEYSPEGVISSEESGSIFSLVERIAKARGLSEKISSIKSITSSMKEKEDSREVGVEVKMRNLTTQNIVNYLFTLENPPYSLNIKEIQLSSPQEGAYLEATFIASRWEKK